MESEYRIDLQLLDFIDNVTHEGLQIFDQPFFFGERGRYFGLESVWYRFKYEGWNSLSKGLQDELAKGRENSDFPVNGVSALKSVDFSSPGSDLLSAVFGLDRMRAV